MRKFLLLIVAAWFVIHSTHAQEFAGGSGTEADPWQVETVEHLNNIRNYLGAEHNDKFFIQTADIDFEGMSFEPIGHGSGLDYTPFQGTYDGDNHSIRNFIMIYPDDRNVGLFAFLDAGEIRNLNILQSVIEGDVSVGVIAGSAPYGHIINCNTIQNHITGSNSLGGIVGSAGIGYDPHLFIEKCASHENVITGEFYTGGIAGTARGTRIQNCYSSSSVTATETHNHPNMGTRSFCGGIAGHNAWGGEIINCYSVGPLSAADGNPAGISAFYSWYGAFVSGCYWDTEASGTDYTFGSGAGRTTDQMTFPYDADTYVGWDFETIWVEDVDADVNNGYPYINDFRTTLSILVEGEGTVKVNDVEYTDPLTFAVGTEVEIEAIPQENWNFVNWTEAGDEVSAEPIYTFAVGADRELTANFEEAGDVSVNFPDSKNISIYPNPSAGRVHVESESQITQMRLIDITGRIVYSNSEVKENSYMLNLSNFENGLYILQLEFKKHSVNKKLILKK